LLGRLFRDVVVTRHNAEQIDDRLDPAIRPSVVLMNPPFSASPKVEGRFAEAAIRHISSALARLAEGGRLVAITGHNIGPDQPAWREAFVRLQQKGRVVFTAAIAGRAYVRHGTTIETRLTVIDRVPAEDPRAFPDSAGMAADAGELLDRVSCLVPPRQPVTGTGPPRKRPSPAPPLWAGRFPRFTYDRTLVLGIFRLIGPYRRPGRLIPSLLTVCNELLADTRLCRDSAQVGQRIMNS
jgi:hypothetical protein